MLKYFKVTIYMLLQFLLFSSESRASNLSLLAGGGSWYGDETDSSFSFGGGMAYRFNANWLEVSLGYERSPIKVKSTNPLSSAIQGHSLNHFRANLHFPTELNVFGKDGYLFPTFSYVLVTNQSKTSHGFGIGGGLGIYVYEKIFGVRFEALNQYYRIPFASGGKSSMQDDFFLSLRLQWNVL